MGSLRQADGSGLRALTLKAVLGAMATAALLSPGEAHALDWVWTFMADPGSSPSGGPVSGTLLNLPTGNGVSGAGTTAVVVSTPGGELVNQPFT